MQRRKYLVTIGAMGGTTVAGCTGSQDDGEEESDNDDNVEDLDNQDEPDGGNSSEEEGQEEPEEEVAVFEFTEVITDGETFSGDDEIQIGAIVKNTGNSTGEKTVSLNMAGETILESDIKLEPGEETNFGGSWEDTSEFEAGTFEYTVQSEDDEISGSFVIEEPASFEVVEYSLPETVSLDEEVDFTITVRNSGGQTGSATLPVYYKTPDTNWQEYSEVDITELEPGETTTLTVWEGESFDYINRYEFGLGESSKTTVVQTVSAKISWGTEYTTPEGYLIRVDTPNLQDTYEYEDYSGETAEKSPDSGGQWAFINVWVKNQTGQRSYSPLASEFALLYGDSQSDGETLLFDDPINKGEPFDGGELQPEVERSGWIAYQIPGNLSEDDLTMAWSQSSYDGQVAVNWESQ